MGLEFFRVKIPHSAELVLHVGLVRPSFIDSEP